MQLKANTDNYKSDIVRNITSIIVASEDIDEIMNNSLETLGRAFGLNHVYIFEDDVLHACCMKTFEWYSDGKIFENEKCRKLTYSDDCGKHYINQFDENGIFVVNDITKLPDDLHNLFELQGVKAVLQCGIYEGEQFSGFIGFDDFKEGRVWSEEIIGTLCMVSSLLGYILIKEKKSRYFEDELSEQRNQYRDALLSGAEYYYVADITDDVVINPPVFKTEKTGMKSLGLKFPMGFDEYIRYWKTTLQPIYKETHAFCAQTRDELLAAYQYGERAIQVDYKLRGKDIYCRKTALLYERKRDGHLIASVVIHDITNERSEEENHRALLEALQNVFSSMYELNMNDHMAREVRNTARVSSFMPSYGRMEDLVEIWAAKALSQEIYEENRDFWDFETLSERLEKTNIISRELMAETVGWLKISIVVSKRDEQGKPLKLLWMTRVVDEEKKAELKTKAELKEATETADHDELTGICNRHGFNKRVKAILEDKRVHSGASIMMDIDDFKEINDTYGHEAGDVVLKGIAQILKSVIRKNDQYSRWGGEEFNAFIYQGDDAGIVAERIRQVVEESTFMYKGIRINVTLSLGVCMADDVRKLPINEIINIADKCLYVSKRNGKNRVTVEKI